MAKKRSVNPFGLSFLDVMSCGFGAVLLVFMLIKHNASELAIANSSDADDFFQIQSEEELAANIGQLKGYRAKLAQEISNTDKEIVNTLKTIAAVESKKQNSNDGELDSLKKKLKDMQAALVREKEKGQQTTTIKGDGKRQYLTGLHVEGKRILILFDHSASMIDDELVNIIRGKYLPASERRKAGKWQWGVSILRWLLAHLPADSYYQVYSFSDKVTSLAPENVTGWVATKDKELMKSVLINLGKLVPENGTDMQSAFRKASELSPKPSSIYIVTDGLPTLKPGGSQSNLVTGDERIQLFSKATADLPKGIPVHTIMLPTKGDPRAVGHFWALSTYTGGRLLAPAWDWP